MVHKWRMSRKRTELSFRALKGRHRKRTRRKRKGTAATIQHKRPCPPMSHKERRRTPLKTKRVDILPDGRHAPPKTKRRNVPDGLLGAGTKFLYRVTLTTHLTHCLLLLIFNLLQSTPPLSTWEGAAGEETSLKKERRTAEEQQKQKKYLF